MINLEKGEKITRTVRKHWFGILLTGIFMAILAVLPALLFYFTFFELFNQFFISGSVIPLKTIDNILLILSRWGPFLYSLWLLLLWTFFFVEWSDYYLDTLVITDRRVINIEQKGLLKRTIKSVTYNNIRSVTAEMKGVFQKIFQFGEVRVVVAGELFRDKTILMQYASDPVGAREAILSTQREFLLNGN
jgi:hypothetical protein